MRELKRPEVAHLDAPYGLHLAEDTAFGLELPYASLKGPGFERLCFHLLLADGKSPRFFGESGNAQFGIDLIDSDGDRCEVYQCKNVAGYNARKLESDLEKFEREWLVDHPDLIRPTRFTLCVPERLTGRDDWEKAKKAFRDRTGITVSDWGRDTLNARLKHQPDIVSDLFGDAIAERYCKRVNWNDGRFRPLLPGSGDPAVERFLELAQADQVVIDPTITESFHEILGLQSIILIEGRSGTGKTIAGLALAQASKRRVFFVRVDDSIDENTLFEGVKARCVRETTFVIDDCQRGWHKVENAIRRWRVALRGRDYKLVLTAQTAPSGTEMVALGDIDLVNELRQNNSTIEIAPDETQIKAVLTKKGTAWAKATNEQVKRLHGMTAGSLAILDLIVTSGAHTLDGDESIESIAARLLKHWFGTKTPVAPLLKAFAAVAQFDIAFPAQAAWPEPEGSEYRDAIQKLIWRFGDHAQGVAPSWRFSHPAAAEMLFRCLTAVGVEKNWLAAAARCLIEHFCRNDWSDAAFTSDLALFLRSRLRLSDDALLKTDVLGNETFQNAMGRRLEHCSLSTLTLAAFLTRESGKRAPYGDWVSARLLSMLAAPGEAAARDFAVFRYALRTLGLVDPFALAEIEKPANFAPMLRLIRERGTIFELFKILEYTTPEFAAGLIGALDHAAVADVVDKTIKAERSIGTLSLALRELSDRPMPAGDSRTQLEALQEMIGGAPMLRLIRERGTIFELFKILEYTTPEFAAGLIGVLDEAAVADLVAKTIKAERSIGTLHLALRELSGRPMPEGDGRTQLRALQGLIGGTPMLRLIRERGTIFELFMILKHTTPQFAAGLIGALNEAVVADLIHKTIKAERGIGTLSLALRELGGRPMPEGDDRTQLQALQGLIGGAPILRLICERGTFFDLFKILENTTPEFAAGLIGALDDAAVADLIDKTIKAERSIGTLSFALRELSGRPMPEGDARTQLQALQGLIGGAPMLRLIRERGTIFELFVVLEYTTPEFAAGLIGALDAQVVADLVDKTIKAGQSIGTLNLALRALSGRPMPEGDGCTQSQALEELLGEKGFWRLAEGAGDLNDLAYLLEDLTPEFRTRALTPDHAPDGPRWSSLMRRGNYFHLARFAKDSLRHLPPAALHAFAAAARDEAQELAEKSSWAEIGKGMALCESIESAPVRMTLGSAALSRIERQDLASQEAGGFVEAASRLRLIWRYREPLRREIAAKLPKLVPPRREWPKDYQLLLGARLLLEIGAESQPAGSAVGWLLETFAGELPAVIFSKADAHLISSFVWNLGACCAAKPGGRAESLSLIWNATTQERVFQRLDSLRKAKSHANDGKLNLLALAGAMAYFIPAAENRLRLSMKRRIVGFQWLLEAAEALTFVPAALATIGLSLIGPPRLAFERSRLERIIAKAAEYESQGPAIHQLIAHLRREARR
ncbi:MAG: hypothetical protein ABR929_05130 [Roseiarcus sp.]